LASDRTRLVSEDFVPFTEGDLGEFDIKVGGSCCRWSFRRILSKFRAVVDGKGLGFGIVFGRNNLL
jgi:hypothetical protein